MEIRQDNSSLVIGDVRAVLPDRIAESVEVRLEDGVIARITASERGRSDAKTVARVEQATLYPGFIDTHIHGAMGVDAMEASSSDLQRVSEFLVTQGVTSWLPTLVPASPVRYADAITAIERAMKEQGGQTGARVLGVHYEGPFINEAQCGALHQQYFRTYSRPGDLDELPVPEAVEAIRMITLAPEIEGGLELVRELRRRGWAVSLGHTRANIELLDQAFEAGAGHMTHFMNAMPPLHHRAPGPVGWGLSRDDVTCDVIADGIHLDPLVLQLLLKTKGAIRLSLISDAIAAAGKGDGQYNIWGETIAVKNGRTSNSRGSIAGSVITMLQAVRLMHSLGASELDVASMSSRNPARFLGIDHECGSIERGRRADLVALDSEGNVRLTLVGGEVAYQNG